MKKFFAKNKIFYLFFYFTLFVFLLYNSLNYLDPDLGWHLKVGQEILENKDVPHLEHFDFSIYGQRWVDHEWLINLISYFVFNNYGYISLNVFFALIIVSLFLLLTVFTKNFFLKNNQGNFAIFFWQILGVLAIAPHIGVRMQELTLLFLSLELIIIHLYNKNKNFKILFFLIPLIYFWSCAHGGFLIGIFLLFFFIFIKIIENFLIKFSFFSFLKTKHLFKKKNIFPFLIFSLLSFFSTLFTPYGLELYSFLSGYTNSFYLTHISEWLPAWYYPTNYIQLFYNALAITLVALLLYSIIKHKEKYKIDLWQISLFFLFFLLGLKARRHFPLFFVASFPFLVQISAYQFKLPPKFKNFLNHNFLIKTYLQTILFLCLIYLGLQINWTNQPFKNEKFCQDYPCRAIEFLQNHPEYYNYKMYNDYNFGGFMIWTYPQGKLFIDGRLPQYEFANHSLMEEYYEFNKDEQAEKKLDQYKIDLVFLKKYLEPKFSNFDKAFPGFKQEEYKENLKEYLKNAKNWKMVYDDNISSIYVREKNNN